MVFEYGLLPGLKLLLSSLGNSSIWVWVQPILSLLFGMIWVLPLLLLSKVVNGLWFQDIADSAYKFRKGRPQLIPSFSRFLADILFNLLVQFLFLIQVSNFKLIIASFTINSYCLFYFTEHGCKFITNTIFRHTFMFYSLVSFIFTLFI